MFTCRDGKGGKLSSQASKMLYKTPGAVYIASYKEPLDQSDCWKLFVHFWNYTNVIYIGNFHMASLKFKQQNYWSPEILLSWCIRAAEN